MNDCQMFTYMWHTNSQYSLSFDILVVLARWVLVVDGGRVIGAPDAGWE